MVATMATVLALAIPAAANAAKSPGSATITSCKGDALTVAGRLKLTGKAARKVRGANLQMRFQAVALFGLPRASDWRDLGRKSKGSGQQVFTGLGFDNWVGVMSWRFKKGRRTVMSGDERSQPLRIGGANGQANCTLFEGAKPLDTTPPTLYILPVDDNWHHAPASVQLTATDDFSGVKGVRYSLDGGPITPIANGGTITIPTEGAHTVDWAATDVAGNTGTRSAIVRVDANPPTKPVLQRPFSVTASQSPTFQWTASTDSGSGLRGYLLTIRRADGSVVAVQKVDPGATSAPSPVTLDDNQSYSAVVTAIDNTADQAWGSDSDPLTFKVDTTPAVDSTTPADGSVLSGAAKSGNITLNLDRPADPATVNNSNVVLTNVETNTPISTTVGCASSACTAITVDPQPSPLPEGRYTLTATGLKSQEGVAFAGFTGHYSVPFIEGGGTNATSSALCNTTNATSMFTAATPNAAGETGTLDFDWDSNGANSWTLEVQYSNAPAGGNDTASGSGTSGGHVHLGPFNLQSGTITFKLTVIGCPSGTKVTISNAVGARVP